VPDRPTMTKLGFMPRAKEPAMFLRLCAIGLACALVSSESADKAEWFSEYSRALEVARTTGKPLFVVFRCEH